MYAYMSMRSGLVSFPDLCSMQNLIRTLSGLKFCRSQYNHRDMTELVQYSREILGRDYIILQI